VRGGLFLFTVAALGPPVFIALLELYGPMFAAWGFAGFVACRQADRLIEGMKIGALVAVTTFIVFDLAVIVRVNVYLDALTGRSDWQNLVERFRASGRGSLRTFVNYAYFTGAPFKILVASGIGASFGFIGGVIGKIGHSAKQAAKAI
jgi:hypothetical protein